MLMSHVSSLSHCVATESRLLTLFQENILSWCPPSFSQVPSDLVESQFNGSGKQTSLDTPFIILKTRAWKHTN